MVYSFTYKDHDKIWNKPDKFKERYGGANNLVWRPYGSENNEYSVKDKAD